VFALDAALQAQPVQSRLAERCLENATAYTGAFFSSLNGLGWMVTTGNAYPYVDLNDVPTADGQGSESGWAYVAETGDGTTWLYFWDGTRATTGTNPEYPGWWQF